MLKKSIVSCLCIFALLHPLANSEARQPQYKVLPVPMDITDPSRQHLGDFRYAGGIEIRHPQVHGLSDLESLNKEQLIAVSDNGKLVKFQIQLDDKQQLVGAQNFAVSDLIGQDGNALQNKPWNDAEGLALLPGGEMLISFEKQHRILHYKKGAKPIKVNLPQDYASGPDNFGMEALAYDPFDATYIVGDEDSQTRWRCGRAQPCRELKPFSGVEGYPLVGMKVLSKQVHVYLFRKYDGQSNQVKLRIQSEADQQVYAELDLAPPLTIDNFEGLAAVRLNKETYRFYLLSDDNENMCPQPYLQSEGKLKKCQYTFLLAYDWHIPVKWHSQF